MLHERILWELGETALVIHGKNRSTDDVDFAITAESLSEFEIAAEDDHRFKNGSDGAWYYCCSGAGIEGISVKLEFLAIGGEFVPKIRSTKKIGASGACVASLGDLAVLKAYTYLDRMDDKDIKDLVFHG